MVAASVTRRTCCDMLMGWQWSRVAGGRALQQLACLGPRVPTLRRMCAVACCLCACSILRDRLQRAEQQQQEAAADDDMGEHVAAPPSISLFALMREGRLSRTEAAKLFYQVCGECL